MIPRERMPEIGVGRRGVDVAPTGNLIPPNSHPFSEDQFHVLEKTLREKDFYCPITLELFALPIHVGCGQNEEHAGHIFEFEIIGQLAFSENNEGTATCPLCRKKLKIENFRFPWSEKANFHKQITDIAQCSLEKMEKFLEKEQHRPNLNACAKIFENREGAAFFNKHRDILLNFLINNNRAEQGVEFWKFLLKNQSLLEKIEKNVLNDMIPNGPDKGISALWFFSSGPEGIQLLATHQRLLGELADASALNQVAEQYHQKTSALFWLVSTLNGLDLLTKHPRLLEELANDSALNHLIANGPNKGKSALWLLASSPRGLSLLQKHPRLLELAKASALNHRFNERNEAKGISALFWLAKSIEGRTLLAEHPRLLNELADAPALNRVIHTGEHNGISPLCWLAGTPDGIQLLKTHPKLLRELAYASALNHVIPAGPYKGTSALWWLARTPGGRALLEIHPRLLGMADALVLTSEVHGISPLQALLEASDVRGFSVLSLDPGLIAKANPTVLGNISRKNKELKERITFLLAITKEGKEILENSPAFKTLKHPREEWETEENEKSEGAKRYKAMRT